MFGTPFVQPQQFMDAFAKMSAEQLERMEQMTAQFEEMQQKTLARAYEAIDESARLMKESIAYTVKLSEEWRKITVDATKKAAEASTAKA